MEDHNQDQSQTVSFWDRPKEELNWFGRFIHWMRDFFKPKEDPNPPTE